MPPKHLELLSESIVRERLPEQDSAWRRREWLKNHCRTGTGSIGPARKPSPCR